MTIARRQRRKRLLFDSRNFPALDSRNHRVTSDPIEEQNCIAYVAGDEIHWWWPVMESAGRFRPPYFWPSECPLEETLEAFVTAFEIAGFVKCDAGEDGRLEDGYEKIGIFAITVGTKKNGEEIKEPTHAAIQSPARNGKWRSKMGDDEDIEHELFVLEGPHYGKVECFMKRSFEARKTALKRLKNRIPSH